MALPKILVLGHSHLTSLLDAYKEQARENRAVDLVFYQFLREDRSHIVNIAGHWQYHPDCVRELRDLIATTQPETLVVMLQGEQAILCGLTGPEKPFEFYFPNEAQQFDEAMEIIPFDILMEFCKEQHGLIPPLLDQIKSMTTAPAFALSPPPPVGSSALILSHPRARELAAGRELTPIIWRYRIWKLHVLALRTLYQQKGVQFIDPPGESYGEDGCLLQRFWSDALHANSRYGHLLLRQLNDHVTSAG